MFNFILKLIDSLVWPLLIIVLIWLVFFIDVKFSLELNSLGMRPRNLSGLIGIFTMPFLHGSFDHLFSNSVPLLLSMGFIFLYFDSIKGKIIIYNVLLTGLILWGLGEPKSLHIGASGLVYAFIFFIVTHAFLSKNKEMIAAAFILVFLYGGLIYGLFPEYGLLVGKNISWEGHLAGAISGVLFAIVFRKRGPQQKLYFLDDDDDDDDDFDEFDYWNITNKENNQTSVHYHYKEKEDQ